jgi:leucyl aminopeptidase
MTFDPVPSFARSADATIAVVDSVPTTASVVGVPVGSSGTVPDTVGVERAGLTASGFDGEVGQTLVVPRPDGSIVVAVGVGDPGELDAARLRDAAGAFGRATKGHTHLATTLADVAGLPPEVAAQVVVEGVLLSRCSYEALKRERMGAALVDLALVATSERSEAVTEGAERGRAFAEAARLARDLANSPPSHLTATRMAEVATAVAAEKGLDIEVFDRDALVELGCGGLLSVNAGSVEPPYMIKLTYRSKQPSGATVASAGRLTLVGKGVMYDSGGISLKPSDAVHATMKTDMSGAAAVLAAMSALAELQCTTTVTGYLMCTDNMTSGSAMKLGDVITIRGGKTVEIMNTDAEGRLIMADALVLATEEPTDAIVDIATLTGACLRALGPEVAGVFANHQGLVDQVSEASSATDEPVWQLLLDKRYRKWMDSSIADIKNLGGEHAGATTAALFLAEFVDDVPWVHLDIAGTAQNNVEELWRTEGGTGFGTRLLIEFALIFEPPTS